MSELTGVFLFTVGVLLLAVSALTAAALIAEPPKRINKRQARRLFWQWQCWPAGGAVLACVLLAIAMEIA